jgi:hypothetical protein
VRVARVRVASMARAPTAALLAATARAIRSVRAGKSTGVYPHPLLEGAGEG